MTGVSKELTLQHILAVEDDPDFLDFKCKETGIILWPLMRVPFFRLIMSDLLYGIPLSGPSSQRQNLFPAMVALARAFTHNLLNLQNYKRDVMVMSAGVGDILNEGKLFNRLSDHFAQVFANDTVVLEDLYQWRWPFPRHFNRTLIPGNRRPLSSTIAHGGTPLYPVLVGAMHDKGFFGFRHSPTSDLARATIGSSDSAQPERCVAALSNPSRYPAGPQWPKR